MELGCIFQDLYFEKGKIEPSVAYKSVAYKKKRVDNNYIHFF